MASSQSDLEALERIFDRITTTSNEDLSNVLDKLLPKLLPLMNQDALRPSTLKILSNVTKRVKLLGTKLPCAALIKLVHSTYKPFSCNFAVVLVDMSIMNEPTLSRQACAQAVLTTLIHAMPLSSFQAVENSLFAYSVLLFDELVVEINSSSSHLSLAVHYLFDWFLDIALCSSQLLTLTHGIIPPGLSKERLDRLRDKNETVIKLCPSSSKMKFIHRLHEKWLYAPIAILFSVLASSDSDPEVSKQATFKLNGMRNFLHSNYKENEIVRFLVFLFRFMLNSEQINTNENKEFESKYFEKRAVLSDDTRCDLLHWLSKEMSEHLHLLSKDISVFISGILQSAASTGSRLLAATACVIEKLSASKQGPIEELAPTLVEYCHSLLSRFIHGSPQTNDSDIRLRQYIYLALENLVTRFPLCVRLSYFSLADLLFKLLDREIDDMAPRLLGALGALRIAFELCEREQLPGGDAREQLGHIGDVIRKARVSTEPRKRITAIQWSVTVFGLSDVRSLETLLMLLDDKNESVATAAELKMGELQGRVEEESKDGFEFIAHVLSNFEIFSKEIFFTNSTFTAPIATSMMLQLSSSCLAAISGRDRSLRPYFLLGSDDWLDVCTKYIPENIGRRSEIYVSMAGVVEELRRYNLTSCPSTFYSNQQKKKILEGCVDLLRMILVVGDTKVRAAGVNLQSVLMYLIGRINGPSNLRIAVGLSVMCLESDDISFTANVIRILEQKFSASKASLAVTVPVAPVDAGEVMRGCINCLGAVVEVLVEAKLKESSGSIYREVSFLITEALQFIYQVAELHSHVEATPMLDPSVLLSACVDAFKGIFSRNAAAVFISDETATTTFLRIDPFKLSTQASNEVLASIAVSPFATTLTTASFSRVTEQTVSKSSDAESLLQLCKVFNYESCISLIASFFGKEKGKFILRGSNTVPRVGDAVSDNNTTTELICKSIEAFSVLNISVCPTRLRVPLFLLLEPHLTATESPNIAFALAEALTRISFLQDVRMEVQLPSLLSSEEEREGDGITWPNSTNIQQTLELLLQQRSSLYRSQETPSPPTDISSRFVVVLFFVYFVHRGSVVANLDPDSSWLSLVPTLITPRSLVNITNSFLSFLLDKDAFIQDISSLALCHCYAYCCSLSKLEEEWLITNVKVTGCVTYREASVAISSNVMSCIIKERRALQPAGFGVAGTTTNAPAPSLMGPDGAFATLGIAPPTAIARAAREINGAAREEQGPTGAEGPAQRRGDNINQGSSQTGSSSMYGVHAEVCKIAKLAGDSSTVFAFLSMVRCDPSFGLGLSAPLLQRYKPPKFSIPDDKLPIILPLLYQAKHHPAGSVRAVMKALWTSLIGSKEAEYISSQQENILNVLIKSLASAAWKDREAAALTLDAFLPQRSWLLIESRLVELWNLGVRLLDDIQPTTVLGALKLMKVLLDHVLRACNPAESDAAINRSAVGSVLPLILDKGLTNSTAEVRGFSLGALVRIIKVSQACLTPWICEIIALLVESMSALEPRTLQYMQFHTARLQIYEDELESFRLKLCQESPMQEALDGCLQALDFLTIPEVARNLCSYLRSGVGLATRVSAAKSLSYLAEKYPGELGPHAVTAFRSLVAFSVSHSKLDALRKSVMSTLGTLAKIIPELELEDSCMELTRTYVSLFDPSNGSLDSISGGEVDCAVSGCFRQLTSRSGDRITDPALWLEILACSYVGSFDGITASDLATGAQEPGSSGPGGGLINESKSDWTKVWSEALTSSGLGTKSQALRQIVGRVVQLAHQLLQGKSWIGRAQGLCILLDIFSSADTSYLRRYCGGALLSSLQLLPGRVWKGQELVLDILTVIFRRLSLVISNEQLLHGTEENSVLSRSGVWASSSNPQPILISHCLVNTFVNKENISLDVDNPMDLQVDIELKATESSSHELVQPRMLHAFAEVAARRCDDTTEWDEVPLDKLSIYDFTDWTLHVSGCFDFLLHEATRGADRQYKLAVAKTLSCFPMELAAGSATELSNISPFCRIFQNMLRLIGSDIRLYSSATNEDRDGLPLTHKQPEKIKPLSSSKPPVSRSNSALFGSRYGTAVQTANPRKRVLPGGSKHVPLPAPLSDMPLVARQRVNMDFFPPAENDLFIDTKAYPLLGVDPAFRVKMLESVGKGLASGLASGDHVDLTAIGYSQVNLRTLRLPLIRWTRDLFVVSDLWSLRRASLGVLDIVLRCLTQHSLSAEQELNAVMEISLVMITMGLEDSKSFQVRVASLECLTSLLQIAEVRKLLTNKADVINGIFGVLNQDKKPEVLEQAAKALKFWALLKISSL